MSKSKKTILDGFNHKDLIVKSHFVKGNTLEIYLKDKTRVIRYHNTDIITITPTTVILNTDGWLTNTTKDRLNEFTPFGLDLYQKNHVWYLNYNNETVMYYDGITFDLEGTIISEIKRDKSKAVKNYKKLIKKFVNRLDRLTELPMPSGGDCWDCALKTKEGKSMGDLSGDVSHLKSHITEGYLHGSLIYNALKEKHGNLNFISMVFQSPEMFVSWRDQVKRALNRYLQDKIIPSIINS